MRRVSSICSCFISATWRLWSTMYLKEHTRRNLFLKICLLRLEHEISINFVNFSENLSRTCSWSAPCVHPRHCQCSASSGRPQPVMQNLFKNKTIYDLPWAFNDFNVKNMFFYDFHFVEPHGWWDCSRRWRGAWWRAASEPGPSRQPCSHKLISLKNL